MIFVDSSVWIDFFNGRVSQETDILDQLLSTEPVGLGDLVLIEVLQGFRHDRDYRTAKALLTDLSIFPLGGLTLALKSADNFRYLRKRGMTIRKTIDVMIATYCIVNDLPLLHSDKDFDAFHKHLNLRNALDIA